MADAATTESLTFTVVHPLDLQCAAPGDQNGHQIRRHDPLRHPGLVSRLGEDEEARRLPADGGVGVCGIFPYEVAETKVNQVMDFARQNQHPLQCTLEKA